MPHPLYWLLLERKLHRVDVSLYSSEVTGKIKQLEVEGATAPVLITGVANDQ